MHKLNPFLCGFGYACSWPKQSVRFVFSIFSKLKKVLLFTVSVTDVV